MALPGAEEIWLAAERIVRESPAAETVVVVEGCEDRFVRFAESGPTQNADRARLEVTIAARMRSPDGFQEARVTCASLAPAATRAALARALEFARCAPPNSELLPCGGPVEVPESARVRPTADHSFQEKAAWISTALGLAREHALAPAGLARTSTLSRTLVNSAGRSVQGFESRASFAMTATGASGSGAAQRFCANVDEIDAEQLARRAVDTARRAQHPRPIAPGRYAVVLAPAAVSALLLFMSYQGFGARETSEGTSFLTGRVGERLFAPEFELEDDVANVAMPGIPFDFEGSPRRRVALVERGSLAPPVTDRYWAKRLGVLNSGHATAALHTPKASNLAVGCGTATTEQLVAGLDKGLFVNQFHYTNLSDPRDLRLTGMTRNGTFLIERGELGAPVQNLRFTESLVEALGRVTACGAQPEIAAALFSGHVSTPSVCIRDFQFTSSTPF